MLSELQQIDTADRTTRAARERSEAQADCETTYTWGFDGWRANDAGECFDRYDLA